MKSLPKKVLIIFVFILTSIGLFGVGILIKIKSEKILTFEKNDEFTINKNIPREFVNYIWQIKDPNYEACKIKMIDYVSVFYFNKDIHRNCKTSTLKGDVINIIFVNQELRVEEILYYNIVLSENYTAEEVMNFYFKNVKFENNVRGFTEASKYYFHKDIKDLDEEEQIKLVAISELIRAEIPEDKYENELNLKIGYIKFQLKK